MKPYSLNCKICSEKFDKLKSLHSHLKKHNYYVADYYIEFYARKNKLTGDLLPFKNVDSYFSKDFTTRVQMNKWLEQQPEEEAKEYIKSEILKRVVEKGRKFLPFHLELENCFLPKLDIIKKYYSSYSAFSQECGIPLLFSKNIPKGFFADELPKDLEISIDTREQKPLSFDFNSHSHKLSFGDYSLSGKHYNYTFVDRKSGNDFCGTLTGENLKRFKRELQLTTDMDSYMFVVVESSVSKIISSQKKLRKKTTIDYLLKNLRDLTYEFPKRCQFVFTENRKMSEFLIPRILYFGPSIWETDLQYFIDDYVA